MPKREPPKILEGGDPVVGALTVPEPDLEMLMEQSVGARFHAGASEQEGVSGRTQIDSQFENTVEDHLDVVSSDKSRYTDLPAPRDAARRKYPHRRY